MPEAVPPPQFDRLAGVYRWLEYLALGPALQRTRTAWLPALADTRRALCLGDGDGRFAQQLCRALPELELEAVDSSAAMLAALRRRCAPCRPTLTVADLRGFTPTQPVDLVTTHFVLDCLTDAEVDALVRRTAPALQPGGLWLLSEFRIPPGPLAGPARVYVRLLYLLFRLLTGLRVTQLPDYARALHREGLTLEGERLFLFGLLLAQLWRKPDIPERIV